MEETGATMNMAFVYIVARNTASEYQADDDVAHNLDKVCKNEFTIIWYVCGSIEWY
jgi:hypothetical protein